MDLRVEGLEHLASGPILVLMRHTSQADTLLVPHLLGMRMGYTLRFVMKSTLRNDPCFDMLGERGHHAFVSRGTDPEGDRAQLAWLLRDLSPMEAVIIFPEGTRTSPEKRRQLLKRLEEKNESFLLEYALSLKHLLPPRLGGTLSMLMDNPGCDLVFCGHVGLEGASQFHQFREGALTGTCVQVRFWREPFGAIPTDERALKDWLLTRWKGLDDWVDRPNRTRSTLDSSTRQPVPNNN
jgi:hypothetical protein